MDRDGERLDQIIIQDLLLRCIVGINPDEREKKQDVVINITAFANLRAACASDDIDETVNYKQMKTRVADLVEESSYFLVEKLAEMVAQRCLEFDKVEAVTVRVDKPGALRFARSVAIEIFRVG